MGRSICVNASLLAPTEKGRREAETQRERIRKGGRKSGGRAGRRDANPVAFNILRIDLRRISPAGLRSQRRSARWVAEKL